MEYQAAATRPGRKKQRAGRGGASVGAPSDATVFPAAAAAALMAIQVTAPRGPGGKNLFPITICRGLFTAGRRGGGVKEASPRVCRGLLSVPARGAAPAPGGARRRWAAPNFKWKINKLDLRSFPDGTHGRYATPVLRPAPPRPSRRPDARQLRGTAHIVR